METRGTIYGIVNDADNGEPVQDGHIALNPGGKTANTGSDGRYEFLDLDPGNILFRYLSRDTRQIRSASM